jgi:hypothetical protein
MVGTFMLRPSDAVSERGGTLVLMQRERVIFDREEEVDRADMCRDRYCIGELSGGLL